MVGFFCFSVKLHTNEGMLKFVVIDNTMRNKGYGCEMLKLAIKYAFEIAKADAVHLNVFRKILVRRNVMKKWDLRKESQQRMRPVLRMNFGEDAI